MAEYIDREALLAAYDAAHQGPPGGARKLIVEAPAADVVEVVHGRWVWYDNTISWRTIDREYKCSVCGFKQMEDEANYCPNCGARMDGE